MAEQLILSARPRTLDALVGQGKVIRAIRKHRATGRVVKNWLFYGPKGTGKTSIARILAVSYQCKHQDIWGKPCKKCQRASFEIYEANASDTTGIEKVREQLEGAYFGPRTGSYRVYIFDEVHNASDKAQDLLLKYLEDTPKTTIFIFCSTSPHKIKDTLRSRCMAYEMRELTEDDTEILVNRLLKKTNSDLPGDRLSFQLRDKNVRSPRLITQAVEKYLAGNDPEDAAQVEASTSVDVYAISRNVLKGEWKEVAAFLQESPELNVQAVRRNLIALLKKILLESPNVDSRADALADAIGELCLMENAEDNIVAASLASRLYRLCAIFRKETV